MYAVLAVAVSAWVGTWYLFNRAAIPPYIPGATRDPSYAPPEVVRGLVIFTGAVILPISAIACGLAFWRRLRQRPDRLRAF
jgi:hypothetical protein